jgi:hypothetical protein
MSQLKVTDNYRTNELSLKPGGHEVTVIHQGGKSFVYDKVKRPGMYIKSISNQDKGHGPIIEILLDGTSVWTSGSGRQPWEI